MRAYSVTQSCLTLCSAMDCILPRLLCSWNFPGSNTGVGCHYLLHGIFLTQGWNLCLLHGQILHHRATIPCVYVPHLPCLFLCPGTFKDLTAFIYSKLDFAVLSALQQLLRFLLPVSWTVLLCRDKDAHFPNWGYIAACRAYTHVCWSPN